MFSRPPTSQRLRACTKSWRVVCLLGLVFGFALWQASFNRWAPVRKAYVGIYHHVAPQLRGSGADLSEGELFLKGLPEHGISLSAGGCVWDVGANDGVWNSNSYYLIHQLGFRAWLFEPDASSFTKLRNLYGQVESPWRSTVQLFNIALAGSRGVVKMKFFPMGLENTLTNSTRQFDSQEYEYFVAAEPGDLLCKQQQQALSAGFCRQSDGEGDFTVLSIDVEGHDAMVLKAAFEQRCDWDLVVAETPLGLWKEPMSLFGYQELFARARNTVFVRNLPTNTIT